MATLNEIVYNIALQVEKADDTVLLERLKFMVGYYRAQFIRQDQKRNHSIPSQFIQKLDEVAMSAQPAVDGLGTTDFGCEVWRSAKIPKPVRLYDGSTFAYVGTVDGKTPYQEVNGVQADYAAHGKYNKQYPRYCYKNERIYVYNASPVAITIKGIFEQPQELFEFTADIDRALPNPPLPEDKEYPISMDMIQRITQSILATEMRVENRQNESDEVQLSE
jgi:hypothetical protein